MRRNSPRVVVRPRTPNDRRLVERLLEQVAVEWRKRHGLSPKIAKMSGDPASAALGMIAVANGKLAGTVSYRIRGSTMYVFDLAVGQRHRRRGVARTLIGRLCDIAQSARVRRVTAHTLKEPGGFDVFRQMDFAAETEKPEFLFAGGPTTGKWTSVYMVRRLDGAARQPRRTPRT